MIQIYHNQMCSKSREGFQIIKESGKEFEVIDYIKNPFNIKELKSVLAKLKIKPAELIRKNEAVWKEKYKNKNLNDEELIEIMIQHPNLIERPIVINGSKAIIGRPPVLIKDIL